MLRGPRSFEIPCTANRQNARGARRSGLATARQSRNQTRRRGTGWNPVPTHTNPLRGWKPGAAGVCGWWQAVPAPAEPRWRAGSSQPAQIPVVGTAERGCQRKLSSAFSVPLASSPLLTVRSLAGCADPMRPLNPEGVPQHSPGRGTLGPRAPGPQDPEGVPQAPGRACATPSGSGAWPRWPPRVRNPGLCCATPSGSDSGLPLLWLRLCRAALPSRRPPPFSYC